MQEYCRISNDEAIAGGNFAFKGMTGFDSRQPKGKIKVQDIIEGINCLKRMGELLGKHNIIYRYAMQGIDAGMNTEIEPAFTDDYIMEAFVAEAIIQNLKAGLYIDITDIKRNFKHEHFRDIACQYAKKYNIT